ncbi:MAG: hypothetical protein GXY86_04060 [Firmicutes bacterium]|nr:hypothetical protein [Bacillota bacterium]
MAKKIQAWTEFRPRLESTNPMTSKELIENIIAATNQSRGSVQAVLSELDVQIESALKSGAHCPITKQYSLSTHRQKRRFREY